MKITLSSELHLCKGDAKEDFQECHASMVSQGMVSSYPPVLHEVELHSGQKAYKYVLEMRK
tara:strand:+ start:115 stop:297 length:183 start_codon:yes stop_codon:yes gene_type:complete